MKRMRFSEAQIIGILNEVEAPFGAQRTRVRRRRGKCRWVHTHRRAAQPIHHNVNLV